MELGDHDHPESLPKPIPLSKRPHQPRPFPVDALPSWLGEHVCAVAHATQTPVDMAGALAMGMLAACAGGRVVIEVRPGWREPTNLYVVVAIPPGNRKSAVHEIAGRPLRKVEAELTEQARAKVAEAETSKRIAEKAAEGAVTAAGRAEASKVAAAKADAIAAAQLAEAITVPVLPRLLADDVTPEAAASLLAEHGGRIAISSAEGGIFDVLAGRYSRGVPNLDWALKGHAGDPLRVDRKGRAAEYIEHPAVTMILTVQPAVLAAAGANRVLQGRGLLARFLYCMPSSNVGQRVIGAEPVPTEVADRYDDRLCRLAKALNEWTDPAVLTLDPEAAALLLDYERRTEPRLGPDGDLGYVDLITEWASKVVGAAARMAALLHLAANPDRGWSQPVGSTSVAGAIRLADYFTSHAAAVMDEMTEDPRVADARYLLEVIRRLGQDTVSRRDLHVVASRSRFRKADDLDPPLHVLEDHGYLTRRPDPVVTAKGGRRPSPAWAVHPDTFERPA
jgi:replicative DNA helicase